MALEHSIAGHATFACGLVNCTEITVWSMPLLWAILFGYLEGNSLSY